MSAPVERLVSLTYHGRAVEELSKDELLDTVYAQSRVIENLRQMHEDYVALQARMRELR